MYQVGIFEAWNAVLKNPRRSKLIRSPPLRHKYLIAHGVARVPEICAKNWGVR